jgi:hypothetical protein
MKKLIWFNAGLVVGLTLLSFAKASIPANSRMTDDTAIYQKLSEIHVQKQAKLDFDSDIGHLAQLEERFDEKLPVAGKAKIKGALKRISNQAYRFSGK